MLETWELLSYIVTVVGLPLAILVYLFEQHKERRNDENGELMGTFLIEQHVIQFNQECPRTIGIIGGC
jgi:hypothetical protein